MQNVNPIPNTERSNFEIALKTSLTNLSTSYAIDKENLLQKINRISSILGETEQEKFFMLTCVVFETYQSFSNSSLFSSFIASLEGCLKKYIPQVFDQTIPCTPAQKYAMNRMTRQLQILNGVTGNTDRWKEHKDPNGVKKINETLKNSKLTNFCKWTTLKHHIKSLNNKVGRDPFAIELYDSVILDKILDANSKLSFQDEFWFDPTSTKSKKQNTPCKDIAKPILRLEKIEDFANIPDKLQDSILMKMGVAEWKIENFDIQIIANDEQYLGHYIDRIDAINAGVKVFLKNLLESHPYKLQTKKLIVYLDNIAKQCQDKLKNISSKKLQNIHDYQNSLVNYIKFVIKIIVSATGFSEKEVQDYLSRAEDFSLMQRPRPALCTVIKAFESQDRDPEYIITIDKPEDSVSKEIIEDFKLIATGDKTQFPIWFIQGFNEQEQALFIDTLQSIDFQDKDQIVTISSKLRIIPVPSNFGEHTLITYIKAANGRKAVVEHPSESRASHISPRDILKKNADLSELRYFHAKKNLEHIINILIEKKLNELKSLIENKKIKINDLNEIQVPILFQTLISPTILTKIDQVLHADKLLAVKSIQEALNKKHFLVNGIKIKFKIIETNHPLNTGVAIDFTSNETTQESILFLIRYAMSRGVSEQNNLLKAISSELESTSNVSCLTPGRELHLASLEQLIVLSDPCLGISIGSCVSGKDRKGVELIYTNAMRVYFEKYGELFKFYDPENLDKFSKIFAEIYCSKHLQTNAAQNTPGANGLKTPDGNTGYLPNYLQVAIKDWYNLKSKMDLRYRNMNGDNAFPVNNLLAANNTLEIKQKKESKDAWLAPTSTNHDLFKPSSANKWDFLISQLFEKISYYPNASENECFYIDLLKAPLVSIEQKKVVLNALFSDPNKEFCTLQYYVFRAMGFICLSDAQQIMQESTKNSSYGSNEFTISIWAAAKAASIETVENTKILLNKISPATENRTDEITMPLWKKAYLGVCAYNCASFNSFSSVNKGISRGYAYANLLDTVHEKHKLMVLYALLHLNFANAKVSELQKKVLIGLGLSDDNVGLVNARCLIQLSDEEKEYSKKITLLLNDFPTLKILELIKVELGQKHPCLPSEYGNKKVKSGRHFSNNDVSQTKKPNDNFAVRAEESSCFILDDSIYATATLN